MITGPTPQMTSQYYTVEKSGCFVFTVSIMIFVQSHPPQLDLCVGVGWGEGGG